MSAVLRRLLLLFAAAMFALPSAAAEVYRWKDADGVTHYSDSRPPGGEAEQVAVRDTDGLQSDRVDAGASATQPAAPAPRPKALQPSILMYDNPDCGYCRRAERWFNQRGLAFRKIDVTASAANKAAFLRAGGRGTPLIFVDGVAVRGFNQGRHEQLIP